MAEPTVMAASGPSSGPERKERRADPWADFLGRILISASLAGPAALPAAAATTADPPAAECDGADLPGADVARQA